MKNNLALVAISLAAVGMAVSSPPAAQTLRAVEQGVLVSRAHAFLTKVAKIQHGETVLIVSDRSVDELVRAAFFEAGRQLGGDVSELILQGRAEVTDGFEIARQMRFKTWYPDWVWKTASEVDVVLAMTSLTSGHAGKTPELPRRTRLISVPFAHRAQLADPMARGNYPDEILVAIAQAVWKQMWGARRFELSDPEGTALKWTLDAAAWDEVKAFDPATNADHIALPAPYRSQARDMEGWLVGSSTHSGPLPRIRLKIEGGRVVEIHDGRHVADHLRKMFAASASVTFPRFPGPGSNWIEETTLGTHPRHARVSGAEQLGWSAEMRTWNGAPRAGVFHLAIGTSSSGRNVQFARDHQLEVQHLDIELYSPTLVADGRPIISEGHLLALEDPEVRRVASEHGDPEELLRTTWFPTLK